MSKHSQVERVGGIEPPSPAWKAGVIAFIRYPQTIESKKCFGNRVFLKAMFCLPVDPVQTPHLAGGREV